MPGIARAKMTNGLLCEGLSRRFGGSVSRCMGQPRQPCSPEDEGPKGAGQPLLAVGLPLARAQRSSMSSRCGPRLAPAPIADRVAQHQQGIDVLPTEAACQLLLIVLRR